MGYRVRIGGQFYELAAARDIVRPPRDVTAARRYLERLEDWTEAKARALLESIDRMPLMRRVDDDLTELVARLWVEGVLTVIAARPSVRLLDAPQIRDLVEPHHLGDLGEPPKPTPAVQPTELSWVSFEIVDDRGEPSDGQFRCQLDARLEAGELDRQSHRYDDLRPETSAQLYAEALRWPVPDPAVDEPGADPAADDRGPDAPGLDPTTTDPTAADTQRVTTLEVVDDDGAPLPGTARWIDDSGVSQEAKLGAVVEIRGSKPAVSFSISLPRG